MSRRISLIAALVVLLGTSGPVVASDEARILIPDDSYRLLVAESSTCRLDQDLVSAVRVRVTDGGGSRADAVTVHLDLDVNVAGAPAHFLPVLGPTSCVVLSAEGTAGPLVVRQGDDGGLAVLVEGPGPRHLTLVLAAPQGFPAGIRRISLGLPPAAALETWLDVPAGTVLLGGDGGLAPVEGTPGRRSWRGAARSGESLRLTWAPEAPAVARDASLAVQVDAEGVRGRLVLTPPAEATTVRVVLPEGCILGTEPDHRLTRVGPVAILEGPPEASRWSAAVEWPRNVLDAVGTDVVLTLPLPRVEGVPLALTVRSGRGLVPLPGFLQLSFPQARRESLVLGSEPGSGATALVVDGSATAVLAYRLDRPSPRDARPVVRRIHVACAVADASTPPLVHVRMFVDNEQESTLRVTDLEPGCVVGAWSAGLQVTPMADSTSTTATVVPLTFFGSAAVPAAGVVDLYYRGTAGDRPTFTLAGARDLPAAVPRPPSLEGGLLDLFSQGLAGEFRSAPMEAILVDLVAADGAVSFLEVPAGALAELKPAPPSAATTSTPAPLGGPIPLGLAGSVERWALVPPPQGLSAPFTVGVVLVRPVHRRVSGFLLFLGGLLLGCALVVPDDAARLRALGLGVAAILAGVVSAPPLDAGGLAACAGGAVVAALSAFVVFAVRPDPVEEGRS